MTRDEIFHALQERSWTLPLAGGNHSCVFVSSATDVVEAALTKCQLKHEREVADLVEQNDLLKDTLRAIVGVAEGSAT